MARRACALITGGKDSTYALVRAVKEGYEIVCVATAVPERSDSWMFQTANIHMAQLVAEALGFEDRHVKIKVSGVKEKEVDEFLEGLKQAKREYDFDILTVGAIASKYQRARIERIAKTLGVEVYAPQWGMDPEEYLLSIVREGIKFIITSISTMGLPVNYLGVPIDESKAHEIIMIARKYGFHPAFEGGEAETLAFDSPLHRKGRVCLKASRVKLAEFNYILRIEESWISQSGPCIIVDGEVLV